MTLADVGKVLAKASAGDGRKASQAQALLWLEVLAGYELDECLAAVTEHFATSDAYLMPIHVRRIVETWRSQARAIATRNRAIEAADVIDSLTAQRDRSADVDDLVQRLRSSLPDTTADDVFHRTEWVQARRERQREARPDVPNPLYTGPPPPGGWPVPGDEAAVPPQDGVMLTDDEARPLMLISRAEAEAAERASCHRSARAKTHGPHIWTDGRPPYLSCDGIVGRTL